MNEVLGLLRRTLEVERQFPGALPGKSLHHIKLAIKFIKIDPMMQKEAEK